MKSSHIRSLIHTVLIGLVLLISMPARAIDAPVGVRPCCAFGTNLKAKMGSVPVPFFSLANVVAITDLGGHQYNDGRQGVVTSLLGVGREANGLIYTRHGGFIDIAHVRDTADNTYYLYQQLWPYIGTDYELALSAELRTRQIVLHQQDYALDNDSKRQLGVEFASVMAYQLAQWHEVAQWFGMTSVGGWSELASAFSPEDLYSNMLGAILARDILQQAPNLGIKQFSEQFSVSLAKRLTELGAEDAATTQAKLNALDGNWWNSNMRLPDKWVLQKRDYQLHFQLMPHGAQSPVILSLPDHLDAYGE
ncbi:MAG: DUF4056 domain-containing protein, partial [Shewanella sp.]